MTEQEMVSKVILEGEQIKDLVSRPGFQVLMKHLEDEKMDALFAFPGVDANDVKEVQKLQNKIAVHDCLISLLSSLIDDANVLIAQDEMD